MRKSPPSITLKNTLSDINKSIINRSTSKQLNTFTKAQRFSQPKYPPYFYAKTITQTRSFKQKSVRFPTIPKADKTFYFNKSKQLEISPSPLSYQVKYQDESWKIKHKGETLGKKMERSQSKQKIPGPTDYPKPELAKKSFNRSDTFYRSLRNVNEFFTNRGQDSPGPMYETSVSISQKRRTLSNFKKKEQKLRIKTQTTQIKKEEKAQQSQRLSTHMLQKQLIAYREKKIVIHKKKNGFKQKKKRDSSMDRTKIPVIIPGPGKYVSFSEFSGWS